MRSAYIAGPYRYPLSIVPDFGKVSQNTTQCSQIRL
nr:MAG TPA: hypothetical protein [Caudoviricetes sp.]